MDKHTVLARIAQAAGVSVADLIGPSRVEDLVAIRHMAAWILRDRCHLSSTGVGHLLHRDHTTILAAWRNVAQKRATDPAYRQRLMQLQQRIDQAGSPPTTLHDHVAIVVRVGPVQLRSSPPPARPGMRDRGRGVRR